MKYLYIVLAILIQCSIGQAQSIGWREMDFGHYVPTGLLSDALVSDSEGNVYMLSLTSNNAFDILIWNGKDLQYVYKITHNDYVPPGYDPSHGFIERMVTDDSAGLYFLKDHVYSEIIGYGRFGPIRKYYQSIIHWQRSTNTITELIPFRDAPQVNIICSDSIGNLYAAGSKLMKWVGYEWNQINTTNGLPDQKMCVSDKGNLYAELTRPNNLDVYVAKLDSNNTWQELGLPSDPYKPHGTIECLVSDNKGNLYATGSFRNAANNHYIAKWDGFAWSEVGAGYGTLDANGKIHCIAIDKDGNIYAGGNFTNASKKHYVAKWDGYRWTELGAGSGALNAQSAINKIVIDKERNVIATWRRINEDAHVAVYHSF